MFWTKYKSKIHFIHRIMLNKTKYRNEKRNVSFSCWQIKTLFFKFEEPSLDFKVLQLLVIKIKVNFYMLGTGKNRNFLNMLVIWAFLSLNVTGLVISYQQFMVHV
jgi:hypothetical protein